MQILRLYYQISVLRRRIGLDPQCVYRSFEAFSLLPAPNTAHAMMLKDPHAHLCSDLYG